MTVGALWEPELFGRAVQDGLLEFERSGRTERIVYKTAGWADRWGDPEEKVRASFFAELIYQYGYDPNQIGVEVIVPDRAPNDRADLVVFQDDARKSPYAVIECKRDDISDAQFAQAVEQAWGNGNAHKFRARFVGVVAGATRRFLDCSDRFKALERDANIVADLPAKYGAPPEYKYRRGSSMGWQDVRPVSKDELIAAIRKCHQTLWGGGRLSPPAAFGEFCKIIFVKVRDEKSSGRPGDPYEFQIKTDESAQDLGRRIRSLYEKEQRREPDVFTDPIKIDDGTLKMCVSHLEGISFSKTDLDTKGVAFEQFLDGFFKGDFGQFFTPREIIQFAVEMLQPNADEWVLDPACGSGGFLLYAMDHVRNKARDVFPNDPSLRDRYWHDFARTRLFGVEINEEISRVAKMNMILHDDGHTNIVGFDALSPLDQLGTTHTKLRPNEFDIVLTNPPFGATIREVERGASYMQGWELLDFMSRSHESSEDDDIEPRTKKSKQPMRPRSIKTEILFCERVWRC